MYCEVQKNTVCSAIFLNVLSSVRSEYILCRLLVGLKIFYVQEGPKVLYFQTCLISEQIMFRSTLLKKSTISN